MCNLLNIRCTSGITQQEAADHLGMSLTTFQHFETHTDEMNLSDFVLLADLYKVDIKSLLS